MPSVSDFHEVSYDGAALLQSFAPVPSIFRGDQETLVVYSRRQESASPSRSPDYAVADKSFVSCFDEHAGSYTSIFDNWPRMSLHEETNQPCAQNRIPDNNITALGSFVAQGYQGLLRSFTLLEVMSNLSEDLKVAQSDSIIYDMGFTQQPMELFRDSLVENTRSIWAQLDTSSLISTWMAIGSECSFQGQGLEGPRRFQLHPPTFACNIFETLQVFPGLKTAYISLDCASYLFAFASTEILDKNIEGEIADAVASMKLDRVAIDAEKDSMLPLATQPSEVAQLGRSLTEPDISEEEIDFYNTLTEF